MAPRRMSNILTQHLFATHLERIAQRDNVGVKHGGEHVALCTHVFAMVTLEDAFLAHDLHRVDVPRVALADLKHLAKRALANDPQQLKVVGTEACRRGLRSRHVHRHDGLLILIRGGRCDHVCSWQGCWG